MTTKSLRGALAADPFIGAGNVLGTVLAHGADPDGPGLTFDVDVDGHPAYEVMSLGKLDERVNARAAWLHAHGIGRRDVVAVWTTTAADHILSFLALNRLGAIPALINGNLSGEIAGEYIRRLRATGVLTDARHRELLGDQELNAPHLGDLAELGTGDPALAPEPYQHHQDDPIVITHSSGTTGLPKAVVASHSSLFAATRHLLTMPQAQGVDRILNALPAPHTATILMVNQALGNRAEFLALSSQAGEYVLEHIERWKPRGVFGFAVTWAELSRFDLGKHDLDSVRIWFNTGDCAHEAHIRPLVAVGSHVTVTREGKVTVPGSRFIDGLGSTEMGHSMFHITHGVGTERYGRCIGKPYLFADIAVLALDGSVLGPNQTGHLGVKSPTLAPGYWNDSVTTYRARLNGYYLTGDLVYRDSDGYYFHLDRAVDSVIMPDGSYLHTSLSEERILAAVPEVRDCTVVAVSTGDTVTTDVLVVLGDAVSELEERVREALGAAGSTLRRVVIVSESDIPTGATGKVRKLVLRERHAASMA
ncbi:class I adenylate-forming enzyme family protein [Longispora albida]|uniref:class I adenylate-forming enzyme family protein n=1 Tax=Longispora albida TaxID=203523 RepID=UPI00035DFFF4|nr:class I adenylate-forming enzyme family protein [Longispora albida]